MLYISDITCEKAPTENSMGVYTSKELFPDHYILAKNLASLYFVFNKTPSHRFQEVETEFTGFINIFEVKHNQANRIYITKREPAYVDLMQLLLYVEAADKEQYVADTDETLISLARLKQELIMLQNRLDRDANHDCAANTVCGEKPDCPAIARTTAQDTRQGWIMMAVAALLMLLVAIAVKSC